MEAFCKFLYLWLNLKHFPTLGRKLVLFKRHIKLDIAFVETGYIGFISGTCFTEMGVFEAVENFNEYQRTVFYKKLTKHFGGELNFKGKTIAIPECKRRMSVKDDGSTKLVVESFTYCNDIFLIKEQNQFFCDAVKNSIINKLGLHPVYRLGWNTKKN